MTELISELQTPHALITLSVLGLAVVLFITGALAPVLTVLLSLGLLLACGVLSPQEALAGFGSPALITLLGSLTSFSVALQTTGLADALAAGLQQWLHGWPIYYALVAIFLGTTLLTQVMSNAASVALLAPVAVQLALGLGLSPFALLITVLFGAKPIIPHPRGVSNQPDGVRPRQVSVPGCHSLWLMTHIDHERIDPCADPLALRLILTNTGLTEA